MTGDRFRELRKEILSLATEDYYPLWELRNALLSEGDSLESSTDELLPVVQRMVQEGLLHVYTGQWSSTERRRLDRPNLAALIAERTWWSEPSNADDQQLLVAATEKGTSSYMSDRLTD